jgi:hypothetical protein
MAQRAYSIRTMTLRGGCGGRAGGVAVRHGGFVTTAAFGALCLLVIVAAVILPTEIR